MDKLIIGIGDLHGHYPALEEILDSMQEHYKIFSNRAALKLRTGVQVIPVGDYIDRGKESRRVISTVRALQKSNPRKVSPLLGNHELIALGSLNYAERALRLAQEGEEGRAELKYSESAHGYNGGFSFIEEFGDTRREQFEAYVSEMDHGGATGDWMRGLKPFVKRTINGKTILFIHGGVPEHLCKPALLDAYGRKVSAALKRKTSDPERQYIRNDLFDDRSVFWNKDIPHGHAHAEEVTKMLGLDYMVIGHTKGERIQNFDDCVFDIDVSMVKGYEPAAIVFKREGVFAFYSRRGEELLVRH